MSGSLVRTLAVAAVLGLAACGLPPPTYQDPLSGLLREPPGPIPSNAPIRARQPIVVVLSGNSEIYLTYVRDYDKFLEKWGNLSAERDADPKVMAASVIGVIKAKFPDIRLVDDLNEALRQGAKTVCVVDVEATFATHSGDTTRVDITAIFLDREMKPLSKIAGHGSGVAPYPMTSFGAQTAIAAALSDLDRNLSSLVQ